ncbi:cyclic nucleotide-binding domain-containing protein [Candidatus Riflebacteria bacterium]
MRFSRTEKSSPLPYRLMGLGLAGTVLHLGAHPDDEDIGLLAYLSCKYGLRTVYWSATRGEGGQNRIGTYRDEALGIFRTWESLEARKIDQAEALFGRFFDYGYSKNADEPLSKWGKENLIREIVRAIRQVQPLVVIGRWRGIPGDYHGHHQAVGQVNLEAFEAAAQPDKFPELEKLGLFAWQAQKYYQSMDNSGGDLTSGAAVNLIGKLNPEYEKNGIVRINTGEYDPISGITFQERAWMAYNSYKTQAMGLAPAPGDFFYYFLLKKSLVNVPDKEKCILDGLDASLCGLARYPGENSNHLAKVLGKIKNYTDEALHNFRMEKPEKAGMSILEGLSLLRKLNSTIAETELHPYSQKVLHRYLQQKILDFENVAAMCLGLELECLSKQSRIIPGQKFNVTSRLWNHPGVNVDEVKFKLCLPEDWKCKAVNKKGNVSKEKNSKGNTLHKNYEVTASETASLSCPYWVLKPKDGSVYNWTESEVCGQPFGKPNVSTQCQIKIGNHQILLEKEVVCREAFPGGSRELSLAVVPPITINPNIETTFLPFKDEEQHLAIQAVVYNNSKISLEGRMELVVPDGWTVDPGAEDLSVTEAGSSQNIVHFITIPPHTPAGDHAIEYKIHCRNRDYGVVVEPVRKGVPGLPGPADESSCIDEKYILKPAKVLLHIIDVQLAFAPNYAYVQGAREEIIDSFKPFGIDFTMISDSEMGYIDLEKFDAIVIGPNAYLIRDELRKYSSRFLDYVKNGGTLIVQYQGYLYQSNHFTPYPFSYNQPHDRITDESAPVKILEPEHVLFHHPNRICEDDFKGWVKDRGLYFFGEWDKRYSSLLASADPGEEPLLGGMIECQHGRGTFLYTGYSFFKQVPAGVAGAFRIFANILGLPEARLKERIDFLKNLPMFSQQTEEQMKATAKIIHKQWIPDGKDICKQGDEGTELYIIYRGEVEVLKKSDDGEEKLMAVVKKGACIGEMAALGNVPRTACLRARGDVELLVITGSNFRKLLIQYPEMSLKVIEILVNRFSDRYGTKKNK